ncbi:LCP family protein [Alteribacillus sp. JSM 102045]|uniref:LCP family glycopolymer transferase n=1 Tax=Alteribacillus sp. JSM 102045 TaxID=1562101 RepID=UPI0035BEF2D7
MKKLLFIGTGVIILGILIVGGYSFYLYSSISDTASSVHENIVRESTQREASAKLETGDPLSFLFLGIDNEDSDAGRSDTMIVMTVNPHDDLMKMVSIPRDVRTEIVGRDIKDKINHAYSFGGAQMAMDTVETFLDIPINFVLSINLEDFEDIVDAVDGVTIDNTFAFEQNGIECPEGELDLNGEEALAYVRMRKEDPEGDLGRNERQHQIIDAVMEEGINLSSIINFLNILEDNVRTNMTFDDMIDLQEDYRSTRRNVEALSMTGEGITIDGIYYMEIPEEIRSEVSQTLREHLELN